MEYSSNKLSKMAGVSARALRHYDDIGLLKPARVAETGYRIYGKVEVDILQQILLYKELGFALDDIKKMLSSTNFDKEQAFVQHLAELLEKRGRLDILISNVSKSIAALRGEIKMMDKEKFEGFKQEMIDKNEEVYGEEIRAKFGDEAIDKSNAHIKGLSQAQLAEAEGLGQQLADTLRAAIETGAAHGELAQKACEMHKQWLMVFNPNYNKEYHLALAEMYVADERFKATYDEIAPSCAEFLRDAIRVYCGGFR